jgi:hypothetical protein
VEDKYRAAIKRAVTPKDLERVFLSLLARAKAGDVRAARIIVEYLLGKPAQTINADITANGMLDVLLRWSDDDDQHNASSST